MTKLVDLTGKKFGMLLVLGVSPNKYKRKNLKLWQVQCECGKIKDLLPHRLVSGDDKSCGCSQVKMLREAAIKHGETQGYVESKEYSAWKHMKARCYRKSHKYYSSYGGRGIVVCERWLQSFNNFLEDMGRKPEGRNSIERIDNNGNYDPTNCRWATQREQMRNVRSNRIITCKGKTMIREDWVRFFKPHSFSMFSKYVNKGGMSDEDAVLKIANRNNIIL